MSGDRRRRISTAAAWALAAVLVGSVLGANPAAAAGTELQKGADNLVKAGAVGYLVRVDDGHKVTTATAGLADREKQRRLHNKDQFEAGSQTKTFVAVLTLQLVAQKKVRLDAPVEKYLPGVVPNGANITVRMLLQHTSGLFDYTEDPALFQGFFAAPTTVVPVEKLLSTAWSHDPYFAPGTGWHNSNTNYVVLGELLTEITGKSVKSLIQQRIAKPLKLSDTYLADPFATSTGAGYAHGYGATLNAGQFSYIDTATWTLSWAGAAGALVSTSRDLSTFYTALLSGKLLPKAELAQMKKTVDVSEHFEGMPIESGLGLFRQETACGTVWGHRGDTVGHGTATLVSGNGKRSVSLDNNTAVISVADPNDPALATYAAGLRDAETRAICLMFGKKVPA